MSGYNSPESHDSFMILPKEDGEFLRDHKHHADAIKMAIEKILETDHPRSRAFHDWVSASDENQEWYLENINKIRLVPGGIELEGHTYDLDNTEPLTGSTWEKEAAEEYAASI